MMNSKLLVAGVVVACDVRATCARCRSRRSPPRARSTLESMTVATDASGMATFSFTATTPDPLKDVSADAYFTATATNANRATSEFGSAVHLSRQ